MRGERPGRQPRARPPARVKNAQLGKAMRSTLSDDDTSNASDLLSDVEEMSGAPRAAMVQVIAEWLRKVRYEAVMADRKNRK